MEFFNSTKSIIENIAFISSPLILITILIALNQLKIAKKNLLQSQNALTINSQRDAIKLSLEQSKFIHSKVLPLEIELMKFRLEKKLKMEFFEGIKKFTKDEFYSFPEEKRNNYFFVTDFKNKEKTVKMLEIAEYLNTYAVHFNTKVADDETGFKTSGIYFCNVVEAFYPVIAMVRKKETDIQYSDIKELYTRWKAKITKLRINEDISELTKLREELSDINFKPLGV